MVISGRASRMGTYIHLFRRFAVHHNLITKQYSNLDVFAILTRIEISLIHIILVEAIISH